MDPKPVRAQREKDLKTLVALAVLDDDEDKLVSHMLDFLDDMDGAFTFFAQRKRGSILDLDPGQQIGRWEANVRFNQQMDREPGLYAEMVRHPRYMMAWFTQEATGLPIAGFLAKVKEVRFVEEEPGLHWLLLPACHRGCESVKSEAADACIMCGQPRAYASSNSKAVEGLTTALDRIHAVDDWLVRSLDTSRAARDLVMKDPTQAFAQASQTLFGESPEKLFGIHATRLVQDTDSIIYSIRLADHTGKRAAETIRVMEPAALSA
ncbi:MAG TPA: hypothetical protein VH678_27295 [Xanthobacteraceae bacterium]|jgi:hypothetical protein